MRVEQRLDGEPTLIVIDEGWKALDDDVFVRRVKDWEKTIRKRNGLVGFATQSAQDALESRIASAIIEQAATQIFMANPKALIQLLIYGFQKVVIPFGLRFNQMYSQSGLGGAQGPDMQMVKTANTR